MKDNRAEKQTIYEPVATYLNLGIQMAITIVVFVLLGWWLDGKFDTSPILILVMSFVGIFGALYKFIKTVLKNEKE